MYHTLKKTKKKNDNNIKYYKRIIIKIIIFKLFIFIINSINIKDIFDEANNKLNLIKNNFENDSFILPYIKNISIISHYISHLRNNKKNIVNICMTINNKYIYPVLVSIESALMNCNKKDTLLKYHILCPYNINNTILLKFKSLMYTYSDNLELIIYNMSKVFIQYENSSYSQICFYRLLLPTFIDLKKIIYLDGDTLILQDLKEMYDSPLNDNYVIGVLDVMSDGIDHLGIYSDRYINSGVLLMNLEKLRKDKKYNDFVTIITNETKIFYDQTVLNFALYPKIGILPYKFGMWNFHNKLSLIKCSRYLRQKLDIVELEKAFDNPGLIHLVLCKPKPFHSKTKYRSFACVNKENNCSCIKYYNIWHNYARKSIFYNELNKYYK